MKSYNSAFKNKDPKFVIGTPKFKVEFNKDTITIRFGMKIEDHIKFFVMTEEHAHNAPTEVIQEQILNRLFEGCKVGMEVEDDSINRNSI